MRLPAVLFVTFAIGLTIGFVLRREPDPSPRASSGSATRPTTVPAASAAVTRGAVPVTAHPSESEPSVRCLGLESPSEHAGGHELWPIGVPPRSETTRVELRLDYPAGGLAVFEGFESELTEFTDDRGSDLAAAPGLLGPFWPSWQIAADRRALDFVVHSDARPSVHATALHLAGTLVVTLSRGRETARANVPFDVGRRFRLGEHDLVVVTAGEHEMIGGWVLGIQGTTELPFDAEWRLEDAGGNSLEVENAMSTFDAAYWQQHFVCPAPLDSGTLILESWGAPRRERVPFDVTLPLAQK